MRVQALPRIRCASPSGLCEIDRSVVYNKKGNQLCGATWRTCGCVWGDKLLNVQPLEAITIVNALAPSGQRDGRGTEELTGFSALMSSHSSLETSSLKEAYDGQRHKTKAISSPYIANITCIIERKSITS